LNKKLAGALVILAFLAVSMPAVIFSLPQMAPQQQPLDFTVSGENGCLRFLEKNVSVCYIPFRTGENQLWRLTITCSAMPSPSTWTDLYMYNGYWDGGADHKCLSQDLYPIINDIESTGNRFQANSTYTEDFGEATAQSYTVFFLFPPGGEGTFHVKLELMIADTSAPYFQ
jgi:hypothetical protein